ncbi:hypothetical protein C8B47_00440 [filamentous cyanobacterium CCP4]|nr:hypothetical protein C8B47_00440 [filamentous cyanobacterium CCP4]
MVKVRGFSYVKNGLITWMKSGGLMTLLTLEGMNASISCLIAPYLMQVLFLCGVRFLLKLVSLIHSFGFQQIGCFTQKY